MTDDILVVGDIAPAVRAAVIGVVKALEKAFNTKDPVALSEQFAEETSWSNARGMRLDSRRAIAEFSAGAMKAFLRDSYARYDVVKLMELAPGVVAVNVTQTPTDSAGVPVHDIGGAAFYVIARREDGWKIVAGQNTPVEPAPAT
jgi:uncharacterized protein (TIGR02246 family)